MSVTPCPYYERCIREGCIEACGVCVNYTGPDESVECAYPPCANRLRRSDFDGPQWCSKEHREQTGLAV